MTTTARAMDDLDRLAFRIARTARTHYPHLLAHGFTLADLEERLAPYHETRRELASGGADGYESTLLRLVAGERGYLAADPSLQAACREALTRPSPTVAFVRAWASAPLTLAGGALALATPPESASPFASGAPDRFRSGSMTVPPLADGRTSTGSGFAAVTAVTAHGECACRYCGGRLPSHRSATFCPHCGLNLTTRQCPACSTELEVAWRFCVTCGRDAAHPDDGTDGTDGTDAPDPSVSVSPADPLATIDALTTTD